MREPKRLVPSGMETAAQAAQGAVLTSAQAREIVQRVVAMSKADGVQVSIGGGYTGNIRFAANQVSTAGGVTNLGIGVESFFGPKHAAVTTNDTSEESLRRAVEQSEALARLVPDDPEFMPPLGPQQIREVAASFPSTASLSPADRAQAALTALQPARSAGDLEVAGYLQTSAGFNALGNKAGLFAYHRASNANFTVTARTKDGTGSGWAGADHNDWVQLDPAGVSRRAIDKARLSRNPVAIEPGRYTVIMEPQAVGDLVQLVGFQADARSADEGRSPFSKPGGGNKVGEKIVDERVTLLADPFDPMVLAQPYDAQGLPLARQVIIENGVLKTLFYSRFWAQKQGKEATGFPTSMIMRGGNTSMDEMIASTPRGVLVTRLWYLRQVDPRTILYTGLTRDGTFLIENGKVTRALKNFRFNDSPLFMLNNIEAIGPAQRLAGTEAGGAIVMPALKVRDFNFTSLSDAV